MLGDYDLGGEHIMEAAAKNIRRYVTTDKPINTEWIALTLEQIKKYKLPRRPDKKTVRRTKKYSAGCTEIDSLPPKTLRQIIRACIMRHIDRDSYNEIVRQEERERQTGLAELLEKRQRAQKARE